MKKYSLLLIVLLLLFETGCVSYISSCFDDVDPVWIEDTPPPINIEPPNDFKITPYQAYQRIGSQRLLALKHVWHVYADSKFYYVHDAFLGSNSSMAKKYGVKIDGQTGKIMNR